MDKYRPYDKQLQMRGSALGPFVKEEIEREIIPNTIYKHFKNKYYVVLGIADNATNGSNSSKSVIYRQLYADNKLYIRDLKEFASEVDHVKYPEVEQKYRFEEVELEEVLKHFDLKLVSRGENWLEYTDSMKILCIDRENVYYEAYRPIPLTQDILLLAEVIRQKELNCEAKLQKFNEL